MTAPAPPEDPFSDPDELFDVYDAHGRPAGRVKRRADVHRDGDWHRAFHCWVTCRPPAGGEALLLLQRRGLYKDTWPGKLDASVGGHFRAGETLADVVREVEEEVGQAVRLDQLIPFGQRRAISDAYHHPAGSPGEGTPAGPRDGPRDRELQDVFLWRSTLPLEAFRPQPIEVVALEAVTVPDLLRLFSGACDRVSVLALDDAGTRTQREIGRGDFIPSPDRYYYRVAVLVDLAAQGYPHLVV